MSKNRKIADLQERAVEMAEQGIYPNAQAIQVRLAKDNPPSLVSEAIGDDLNHLNQSFAERLDSFCRQHYRGDPS